MPSMTVLDMVQKILSSMDSDEVNSINDTLEATQIAEIIETTYYNIINGRDWPWLYEMFKLTASGTTSRPTHMQIPSTYQSVSWVKYNKRSSTDTKDKVEKITYLTPEEFMDLLDSRDETADEIDSITDNTSGVLLRIFNDRAPQYYTSFDDEWLVFDAYDSAVSNTLTGSKTQCYGKKEPTFTISNTFVADLPTNMFSYLLNESKAVAFVELKQSQNPKAEQNSISQRRRMSQDAWKVSGGITFGNYGRRSKK